MSSPGGAVIFGSKDDFAIEAMVEPGLEPPSPLWGRMRVWCQGVSFGDFACSYCALWNPCRELQRLRRDLTEPWPEDFSGMSDLEMMNKVDGLLYAHCGDVAVPRAGDSSGYGKYDFLTNWGEMFDRDGKSFIFPLGGERVLVLNRQLFPRRLVVSIAAISSAVDGFVEWLDGEEQRLSHSPSPRPSPEGRGSLSCP